MPMKTAASERKNAMRSTHPFDQFPFFREVSAYISSLGEDVNEETGERKRISFELPALPYHEKCFVKLFKRGGNRCEACARLDPKKENIRLEPGFTRDRRISGASGNTYPLGIMIDSKQNLEKAKPYLQLAYKRRKDIE